jgi:N-acetylmuramoyl-L-alanine amidase
VSWRTALLLAAAALGPPAARAANDDPSSFALSSELVVAVRAGRTIELHVRAGAGDDRESIAARVARDGETGSVPDASDGRAVRAGDWVRVPLDRLTDGYRALVLRSVFPGDRLDGDAWLHRVGEGRLALYDAGMWQVAEWFAGDGHAYERLMRANRLNSPELRRGQAVRIPLELLHPSLHPRERSADGMLEYDRDGGDGQAIYRLRPGEALYSAVVMRFTGRTDATDVGAVAAELMAASGVRDVHDIPVGYEIRIPFPLLLPDFLPAGHPRRIEAEAQRAELAEALEREPVVDARRGLAGVLVIIDPGHGGRDLGTANHGIWEHDYVYDVACRLRQLLERRTSARVVMTLEDEETGCAPSAADLLTANRQGTIRTAPPFLAQAEGDAEIGVNLRWYLANSLLRRAVTDGLESDRVVFLSLHADARHPSLRGVMVYVPGASLRAKTYGNASKTYTRYREVREQPHVHFSHKERVRSEAVSRRLAQAVVRGFREHELPVQAYQPVRDKVIRGSSVWVPAVLRGNAVPAKILVEMVNLSNPQDATLLGLARDRERMAQALFSALHGYFGEEAGSLAAGVAAR